MCWTWSRFWTVFCTIGRWTTGKPERETKTYTVAEPLCMIIISDDESADEEDVPVAAHTYNVTSRGNGSASNHDMDTAIIQVPTETKGNMITNNTSQEDRSVEMKPSDVHAHFSAVMTGDINPEYRHTEIPPYKEHEIQKNKYGNPGIKSEASNPAWADMNPSYSYTEREASEAGDSYSKDDFGQNYATVGRPDYSQPNPTRVARTHQAQPANSESRINIFSEQCSLESEPSTVGTFFASIKHGDRHTETPACLSEDQIKREKQENPTVVTDNEDAPSFACANVLASGIQGGEGTPCSNSTRHMSFTRRHSSFHPDGGNASEHNRLEASTSGIDIRNSGTVKIENSPDQGDSDQGILITNVHTCNPGGSLKCTICAKQFVIRKSYKQHQSAHHRGTVHTCTVCKISFPTKIGLLKHENIHKGKVSFKCKECEMTLSSPRQMELHHASAHPGSKNKPFTCPTCGKSYCRQRNLRSHQWEHTGGRETCPVCGKQFTRRYMRTHQQTHNVEKRYKCTRCDKSFANAGSLYNHRHKRKSSCAQTAHLE